MAGNIVKIIITGVQVVGRAFTKAVQKEYAALSEKRVKRIMEEEEQRKTAHASQQAARRAGGGKKGAEEAAQTSLFGMSLDEAKEILNVNNINDPEKVTQTYEHLMKVNSKESGGSFYLQSKVYRAKERIDMELNKGNEGKSEGKSEQSAT